ncbi:MBL fold metallo-hydrolase [Treponema bryantii]|uniref:MBL fold metallo-hydrolase n=1 Tax=Treponema bryantii TaxID=163 RepID=UPI0003B3C422|nr:MBL fold metallo-hydrolase [Treponema bryantii]
MELKKLSEHIWYMPYESERDRPNLGYVRGKNWSLAIDAGHSAAHTKEFYALLEKENLPLPCLTLLTHWHWDHTFGMHAVNGLTLANEKTNRHLAEWKNKIEKNGPAEFFAIHESIRKEYSENKEVIVKLADIVYSGQLTFDLGDCIVKVIQSEAPHTDDSTLVYIENDKLLFTGDATGDDFFTGIKDAALSRKLAETIKTINPTICMEGHWVPVETDDTLNDLLSGV